MSNFAPTLHAKKELPATPFGKPGDKQPAQEKRGQGPRPSGTGTGKPPVTKPSQRDKNG